MCRVGTSRTQRLSHSSVTCIARGSICHDPKPQGLQPSRDGVRPGSYIYLEVWEDRPFHAALDQQAWHGCGGREGEVGRRPSFAHAARVAAPLPDGTQRVLPGQVCGGARLVQIDVGRLAGHEEGLVDADAPRGQRLRQGLQQVGRLPLLRFQKATGRWG